MGGRSIKNEHGVPIWVRSDCKCGTCNDLRKLDKDRKSKKRKPVTSCKQCGHDMGRSRVRIGEDGEMQVRCNKCETVYTVTIRPKQSV